MPHTTPNEEAQSNTHLCKTAPKMLVVLKLVAAYYGRSKQWNSPEFKYVQDVIAEAEEKGTT